MIDSASATSTRSISSASLESSQSSPTGPVGRFLAALARYDFEELDTCLAPDIWFRALLPKSLHESSTSEEAVEAFRSWYADKPHHQVLELEHSSMPGRELLRYRFLVLPPWAPHDWHIIEQTGFCRVKGDRISRMDLVCTGFHPAPATEVGRPVETHRRR